jgi:hypothetical protein
MFTDVPSVAGSPELAAASGVFRAMIAERCYERSCDGLVIPAAARARRPPRGIRSRRDRP